MNLLIIDIVRFFSQLEITRSNYIYRECLLGMLLFSIFHSTICQIYRLTIKIIQLCIIKRRHWDIMSFI